MIEKRQHPRTSVELTASVTPEGAESVLGRVRDLSIGGMFFECESKIAFGSKVEVVIGFPPPSGTLTIPAVVRWTGDDGVGLQFGLMGAKVTHAIAQTLRRRG